MILKKELLSEKRIKYFELLFKNLARAGLWDVKNNPNFRIIWIQCFEGYDCSAI